MDAMDIERYSRQLMLKEVGGAGQAALGDAKVLIVGAGGLGGPAGIYLAAAGVGTLGLVDDDVVELSNLHRQIQFQTSDIEVLKTDAMASHLSTLNPKGHCVQHSVKIDPDNAAEIITAYDVVLDGTDDFEARFAVNEACVKTHTPLISGALGRFDGQVCAFENTSGEDRGPCYRCLVPD
ncbi:MAG TPA: HesA/MoeB/ThiF family protein, partial [Hellea balneolensis]|nr:HesA/MoeB/ThiF family protein [Hellea balneolensis]